MPYWIISNIKTGAKQTVEGATLQEVIAKLGFTMTGLNKDWSAKTTTAPAGGTTGTTGGTIGGTTAGGATPMSTPTTPVPMPGGIRPQGTKTVDQILAEMAGGSAATGGTAGGTTGAWTTSQQAEYDDYVKARNSGLYPNIMAVGSIDEYWKMRSKIVANEEYYFGQTKATLAQWDEYQRFTTFSKQYGDINDYSPSNFTDFINNYPQAQQQLTAWTTEAGPEATGFTDDQLRSYKDYQQWYYKYGKPGDLMPVDAGDFITNQQKYQNQLTQWKQTAGEVEKYEIDPAEAARRREEGYAEERYAAKERYGETPMYSETFAKWLPQAAGGMSSALREFVEQQYPSLQAQYEGGLPRLTGFSTREAARAEAAKREKGFAGWLGGMTPELEQEYLSQRPYQRGERLTEYAPTLKAVNW